MIDIEIEANENVQESEARNFLSRSFPYPIQEINYPKEDSSRICVEITGWHDGKSSPVYAVKVEDSGDGEAWLIYGGNQGIRLRKKTHTSDFIPFSIKNKQEWGELYLYYHQDLYEEIIAPFIQPFRVLGVQQIAIGNLNKSKPKKLWVELLGAQAINHFSSQTENVNEDILQIGKPPFSVEIDLMEPLDAQQKPKVHEPSLNHIGLWVDDIKLAYQYLEKKGVRFASGGIRKGALGQDVCFIHPKENDEFPISGNGVLIELVQATDEIISAYHKLF